MSDRTARVAAILLVVLMMLAIPACRKPFSPQAISADLVPEDIRSGWLATEGVSDVVWHVSQPDWSEGLSLYAATYTCTTWRGDSYRGAWVRGVPSDPKLHGGSASTEVRADHVFWGQTGRQVGIIEGEDYPYNLAVSINAGGYCFDSSAAEVVAQTTEGREFRCPVTNGFWLIVVNNTIDRPGPNPSIEVWAEITARSSSGRVLHRLDQGVPSPAVRTRPGA